MNKEIVDVYCGLFSINQYSVLTDTVPLAD